MIGVNVFGIARQIIEDQKETLKEISEMGFTAIEPLSVPKEHQGDTIPCALTRETFGTFMRQADDCNLTVPSVHMFVEHPDKTIYPVSTVAEHLIWIKKHYDIDTFIFSGMFEDASGAEKWAGYLKELSDKTREHQCHIVYHNHASEFYNITIGEETITCLEYFFRLTGGAVLLQLDIGWAGMDNDETKVAEQLKDYICSLHLKDFIPDAQIESSIQNMGEELFCAIGEGKIRLKEIIDMRGDFPNFHEAFIIDQDKSAGDIMQDLKIGYQNIVRMI